MTTHDPHRTALHLIDGEHLDIGELSDVLDPATGSIVGQVCRVDGEGAEQLARRAADRAVAAQASWAATSPRARDPP